MTILARPSEWTRHRFDPPETKARPARAQLYFAFISYSHQDEPTARWLHDSLEKFRVPKHLVGRLTEHGPIPRRLTPIFRDLRELPASDDLGSEIRSALSGSRCLIVLCSPAAARSKWTDAEIDAFRRTHPDGCLLAGIVNGEPFASEISGREGEECLPPALRVAYDRRGRPTQRRAEPLAADLRGNNDERRIGFLKLVAGMLGVGLDELVQRETLRRQKRMAAITAGSVVGMLVAAGLAVTAIQARDAARDQRREAEGLVEFMLGDLRQKLEPIGRLDALDGVGARVLEYYSKQDASELSSEGLIQRSKALALMGQLANVRGHTDQALQLYNEALKGTTEALGRDPDNPDRVYDQIQNVFWIGDIARNRGEIAKAEAAMREYDRLANRMVDLDPDSMTGRIEVQYANVNLGIVLFEKRSFAEAADRFQRSLHTIEALATANPANREYRASTAESLAWLADARYAQGRLGEAIAARERHVRLLQQFLAEDPGDVKYRLGLIPAHQSLGNLYAATGRREDAIASFRAAVRQGDALVPLERENSLWVEFAVAAQYDLAGLYLAGGDATSARPLVDSACGRVHALLSENSRIPRLRGSWRDCLAHRSRIALESGDTGAALRLAREALATSRQAKTTDRVADSFAGARIQTLIGDIHEQSGESEAAQDAWEAALSVIPKGIAETPAEAAQRLDLLRRLGRGQEAAPIARRLNSIGFTTIR